MRNIMSDLVNLAEEFLILKNLEEHSFRREMLLLNELKERKLYSQFLKQKEKTDILLEQTPEKNEVYYDNKTELTKLYSLFQKETEDSFVRENLLFQESSDYITAGYLIKMLYHYITMLNRQSHVSNFTFTLTFSGEIDTFLSNEGKRFLEIPVIEAHYLSFKLLQTNNDEYYYRLKSFFELNNDSLNRGTKKNIATLLENYCYSKVTEGKVEFVKEQFGLYRRSVDQGTHIGIEGHISSSFFMSIAATGFEAGESAWVEKFIEERISEVHPGHRMNTLHFCNALKYYWRNDLSRSIEELAKVNSDQFAFKHTIKSLTLKIYFDLNDSEPFYSHIDTYKHFVLNNKIVHEKVREQVNNFIKYSKKLFGLKNSDTGDRDFELHKLKDEISADNSLINKIWLLKKIKELENRS
jgi:hypothetical protein